MVREIKKRVNAAWDKLETLMTKLDPEQLKVLRPPATEDQVNELSRRLGMDLPPSLRYSLLRHDGCGGDKAFLCFEFHSVEKIGDATEKQKEWYRIHCEENETQDPLSEGGWSDIAIMIGTSGAGYELALECINCESGIPHFYSPCSHSMPLNRDYISYLEGLALCLEEGSYDQDPGSPIWLHSWGERTTRQ
jgi:hypothetical protein